MFYNFIKNLVLVFMRLVYGHKIYGVENYPKEGGGIIAANHASFFDPPIVAISSPGQIHFLARGTLFDWGPFGWLIRKLNSHPVTKGRENLAAIKLTLELIEKGNKVLIFPEGTRSPDGQLQSGQSGLGMLVLRTKCQVIPVYVHGSYDIWGKKRKFPKLSGKTACVFGKPLHFTEVGENKKEAQAKVVAEIMEAIINLRKWYLSGWEGLPP